MKLLQCFFETRIEGDSVEFMKTHVTGVLSHGLNGLAICFIDYLRWPQDSNVQLSDSQHLGILKEQFVFFSSW